MAYSWESFGWYHITLDALNDVKIEPRQACRQSHGIELSVRPWKVDGAKHFKLFQVKMLFNAPSHNKFVHTPRLAYHKSLRLWTGRLLASEIATSSELDHLW